MVSIGRHRRHHLRICDNAVAGLCRDQCTIMSIVSRGSGNRKCKMVPLGAQFGAQFKLAIIMIARYRLLQSELISAFIFCACACSTASLPLYREHCYMN